MVKILIDMDKELDKLLSIEKIKRELSTKAETVGVLLEEKLK